MTKYKNMLSKIPFSVLMSIYKNEKINHFEQCIDSLKKQTILPNEIIIVLDGPIQSDLSEKLDYLVKMESISFVLIPLDKNVGLGYALNIGLTHCSNEWIFRMDTDDICLPDRFEKQISYIQGNPHISLVGGNTEEFSEDMMISNGQRNIACEHNDIIKLAKKTQSI